VAQPLLISGSQRYSEYEDFDEEDF
jgi:hypothetical protein